MATGYFTTTNQANIIPELWQKKIFYTLYTKFYMREVLTTIKVAHGHDTEHYPTIGQLTAEEITEGTELTGKNITPGQLDLIINQNYGVPMTFSKRMLTQNQFTTGIQAIYQNRAGEALAYQLETTLLSLYSSMSQSINGTDLTADNLLYARQLLEEAGMDPNEMPTLICTPYQKRKLLQFANIADASAWGNVSPLHDAKLEQYYGIKIKSSANISKNSTYYNNLLVHPEYAMVGIQRDVEFEVAQYDPLKQATDAVASILYGYVETRDPFGVTLGTTN